jgi:hypothetical protein
LPHLDLDVGSDFREVLGGGRVRRHGQAGPRQLARGAVASAAPTGRILHKSI